MSERRHLRQAEDGTPPLSADQQAVFDAYFGDSNVVCTPAGSGTGKTTTAVETVAEAVARELDRAPDRNPFESILVTTFTTDAARQLKRSLKERLREHRRVAPEGDPVRERWNDVVRWLEVESNVQTIDSFTQELLREVAIEAGVAPSFGVADGIRRSDLLEAVFDRLRAEPDLAGPIARLEETFEGESEESWETLVEQVHRDCREFGLPVETARRRLLQAVTEMHAGREPDSFEDLLAIVDELTDYDPGFVRSTVDDPDRWVEHARETYETSRRLAGDFGVVLAAFDETYDRLSRSRGTLTHTDITYVVREFLEDEEGSRLRRRFRESLADRFEYVVVDEFQDTNYAQCRILANLVEDARTLLIGDLKQSVYEWRSAEPRLFAEVIDYAAGATEDNVLGVDDVDCVPLTENFRSHPHLVRAANHLFPQVFSDPGRGGIGTFDVEYDPLTARRVETEPDRAHVHALQLGESDPDDDQSRREATVECEAERVAGTLRHALDEGTLGVDRDQHTDGEGDVEPIRAGDVAILFRTKQYMRLYSQVLDRYGIDNALIGNHSLFEEPEVAAVIDALAWVGRPEDPGAFRRLAESPLVGVSEAGLRELADHRHDLDRALQNWTGSDADLAELRALEDLRSELRYEREGSKAELVSELLVHSALDVVALAEGSGLQRYANLRRFVEVVEGWEEEERLSYREFMRRLRRLRAGRIEDDTTLADIADMDSPETVKLLTAHAAKGLEFPVVVLADTTHDEAYLKACDEPFVADRRHGVALQPSTGTSQQPGRDAFPTFDGGWFHEDDSEYDLDRGLLWLSEIRGEDGRIRHDHPFRAYVRDRRAEFWRLLYVAVTRAGDHLVVPFPNRRGGEWTTWAGAIAEYLDPGEGDLETDEGTVPIGVDDLPSADPPTGAAVGLDELLDGARDGKHDRPDPESDPARAFRPWTVSATQVRSLLVDPAEYQRRYLRRIASADPVYEEDPGVGGTPVPGDGTESHAVGDRRHSAPPSDGNDGRLADLSPEDWGDAVHRTLESIHDDPEPATAATDRLDSLVERTVAETLGDHRAAAAVCERLRTQVVPVYRETDIWSEVVAADPVLPEHDVVAPTPGAVRPPLLGGRVDLLFRTDGWHVVDFKTGTPPPEGSSRADAHRTQVDAYRWLLAAVHGFDPATSLVYLPAGEERCIDGDPEEFARSLSVVENLYVDHDGVLGRIGADREERQ